jgi:N-acetylglucosamine-6-sulfatase
MGPMPRPQGPIKLVGALVATLAAGLLGAVPAAGKQPNVIVVVTDDQELASLHERTMPNVLEHIGGKGTDFTEFVVSGPLCCPARAVNLTGQYGHNNGVTWNTAGSLFPRPGGYGDLREKRNTLPVWMRKAGYRTAHLGRYLNLYARAVGDPDEVPPGWNEWHTMIEPYQYREFVLRRNGRSQTMDRRPRSYLTRVLDRTAIRLIRRQAKRPKPLFMMLDHLAPHASPDRSPRCGTSPKPDPRDLDAFLDEPLPRTPSFNEADVSDKPGFVARRPSIDAERLEAIETRYRCRLASLLAVDRSVGRIVKVLRKQRELGNTALIFTSDNGYFGGQHRIPAEKIIPYEEALRVPMLMRLPARMRKSRVPRVAAPTVNADLVPTILRLAKARPCLGERCRRMDGRPLVGLAQGHRPGWSRDRPQLLGLHAPSQAATPYTPCSYGGIRQGGAVYIEHHSRTLGFSGPCSPEPINELYDLRADPHQLRNLSATVRGGLLGERERELRGRLRGLRECSGVRGRDPALPDRPFCP